MKIKSISPSSNLLIALLFVCGGVLVLSFWELTDPDLNPVLIWLFCLIFTAFSLLDYLLARQKPNYQITRSSPQNISLNRKTAIKLKLEHNHQRLTQAQLAELTPSELSTDSQYHQVELVPGQSLLITYAATPTQRGPLTIDGTHILIHSPLKLWRRLFEIKHPTQLSVFPDFATIEGFKLLAMENRVSTMGIRQKQRRGDGLDFHQLREYREGDGMWQIDWKATAKKQKLISREFQDERDQRVLLMLDTGRRMRSETKGLSHLDHAINGLTLLSHVALKQGDSVGVMSFGHDNRWLACRNGQSQVSKILNHLYDIQPGINASDYALAASELIKKQRKRAMVVMITNTRDEDIEDLLPAIKLIARHHLIVVANIAEPEIRAQLEKPVNTLEEAQLYCGVEQYLFDREKLRQQLNQYNVQVIDCEPHSLPIELTNNYLQIKRAGKL